LGIARAGMVSVPVNTAHVGRMLEHVLRASHADAIVVSADLAARVDDVYDALPNLRLVLAPDASAPPTGERHLVAAHETAMLLFTSGTTGPSKAVVVPWAAARGYWGWVPTDTVEQGGSLFVPMPMLHNAGLGALQQVASRGGRLIHQGRLGGVVWPLLSISRQIIGQTNPRQPILNPGVVARRDCLRTVKTAHCHIDLVSFRPGHERQWRAALPTERPQSPRPGQIAWLSAGEPEAVPTERCPGHERCAAASAAIRAVAMGDVVRLPGYLIAHRAAQTTAANDDGSSDG